MPIRVDDDGGRHGQGKAILLEERWKEAGWIGWPGVRDLVDEMCKRDPN